MTEIEDQRIGKWDNVMLKEFKPIKVAKQPKTGRIKTENEEMNSDEEMMAAGDAA